MNILIFGPNGSGKGTQGAIVQKKYGVPHIETGVIFRQNISKKTPLGEKAKAFIDRGELVPDDITIPMILDRDTDALTAGIASIRVVLENPGVMLLWGALITLLVALALAPWGAGLLVVGPMLGHASWHAYRAAVAAPAAVEAAEPEA